MAPLVPLLTTALFYSKVSKFLDYSKVPNNCCRAAVIDSNRGVQTFEYLQNVCDLREILKIEGCNIGLLQKSRGAIAPLAPL